MYKRQHEYNECIRTVDSIKKRLKELKNGEIPSGNEKDDNEALEGRRPNESERDYLVRTGQITAFGSKTGFVLENDDTSAATLSEEKKENDFEMANEQMVENLTDEDETEDMRNDPVSYTHLDVYKRQVYRVFALIYDLFLIVSISTK